MYKLVLLREGYALEKCVSFATANMLDKVHRGAIDRLACDSESHKGLDQRKRSPESLTQEHAFPGGKVRVIKPKHAEFYALFRVNLARFLACYRPVHAKNRVVHAAKVA